MASVPSRIDAFLYAIAQLVGAAIVGNGILPPTSPRFPEGWPIVPGEPDATGFKGIKYAVDDGGYFIAVDAVDPNRQSNQKWLKPPVLTLADGTTHQETARRLQRVQITVWAATGDLRNSIGDAIVAELGTDETSGQWITLPDSTRVRMQYVSGPRRTDETIVNSQTKRGDVLLDVDYGVLGAILDYASIAETEGIIQFPNYAKTIFNP